MTLANTKSSLGFKTVGIIVALCILLLTLIPVNVEAANSKSGKNLCVSVETSWHILSPKIKITNTGSTPMTVNVENSRGQLTNTVTNLKPGKSVTISLKRSASYTVYFGGNMIAGSMSAYGTIENSRYCKIY